MKRKEHRTQETGDRRSTGVRQSLALILYSLFCILCPVITVADSGRVLDVNDNPYYITSPYDGNDLRDIQYAQLNDIMYLTHPNYPPQKLTRYDHANWTIMDVNWLRGPFLDENTDENITITPSGTGTYSGIDYYNTDDTGGKIFYDGAWAAQTFTAADNYTASGVQIKLYRLGDPGTVTVSLRATAAGVPTGADLVSGSINGSSLTTNVGGGWEEATFSSSQALTSGTVYAIVVRATSASYPYSAVYWRLDSTSPTYAGGSYIYSSDSGSTWTAYAAGDFMFGVVDSNTPASSITLTSNSPIWDANHVGALWQLTHPVDSTAVTGTFTATGYTGASGVVHGAAVAEQTSSTLAVARNQDFTVVTSGYWDGILYLEKSYDDGSTWQSVYPYTSTGTSNLSYSGTETVDDALYRLRMTEHLGWYVSRDQIFMTFRYTMASVAYNRQGIVRITGYTDVNSVTATVLYDLGGTSATYHWAEGAWSDYRGWPRAVCFYQNRLCLAGTAYQPNMLWCSQSGDYENMALGSGLDNEAIAREIDAAGQNPIMWIKDKKGIIAGTTGTIIRIGTPSEKYVFTPSTVTSQRTVETGSCSIQPGLTDASVIYVDRNRRKVRDLKYDVASDDMVSPDLTIFSDDITEPNILEMAWQKRPDEIGWFVRGDGHMLTLSYNPSQGVMAWTELVTDGNYISVCVIPGTDEDEVWTAVVRDSNDYVMIEKFHKQLWWNDDIWFVDSGLEYSGVAATTITGLGHLEGESVQVFSDANGYIGDYTVSSGAITLATSETQCIAGLGYTATIKTFPIEVSTQMGPSVGMTKNIRLITLSLYESEGGRYGYDKMYDILYPRYTTDFYTGLTRLSMDTGYQLEAYLIIDQNEPLPMGVTGIAINKYELSTDN